jgi:hypothetical protein
VYIITTKKLHLQKNMVVGAVVEEDVAEELEEMGDHSQ